ncbi:MAG: RnfABCDGE type electron transport complex subunit D [Gammaproteobacteria bacterium]|jgi:Na+-transporting NADH:ubiquinone oxidoreductase subunit NqrB|nr:RnfABCDGE type electron transport complex subunit D [Gammaproteobacteria bacterium]MDH3758960.1 RnfABCDGE type electron transport complex subunit D [Gammaproteobacteria bacterium]MDH3847632.1 RnfABCDGE type electron transport complex subunit D [Gammaproteobacteria bacterium]MDH3863398.1 RnfABCDGE type electron transport complex subunit D [Gammaproteobacteria bacterium]MDH3905246.1 RnfABCDGE type electron transport complex subunit D [Gammaproteobacteria bacterium]
MDIRARLQDPRYYQIAVLGTLVAYGVLALDFGIHLGNAIMIVAAALLAQFTGTKAAGLPRFDPLSPLITSLSLTLLLRTDLAAVAALAGLIAISSKFLIRVRGKHVFNPANLAIVTLMLSSDHAWVSSGQWGGAAIGAFALACLGFIVLTRAKRAETTIGFLGFYALLLFGRALWLGDPLAIPMHQLQNGALLVFAFFMISDPKTTPDSAVGRVVYSMLVASLAFAIQFVLYRPHGPILALIATAPLVPVIDYLFQGTIYRWSRYVSDSPASRPAHRVKGAY